MTSVRGERPLSPRAVGVVTGALCFAFGFGNLAIMSVFVRPLGRPSMWRYWSGTLGDALLLPTIVGCIAGARALLRGSTIVRP
jgi:hypothetical protein